MAAVALVFRRHSSSRERHQMCNATTHRMPMTAQGSGV
jgi:hypothetical protein